MRDHRSGFRYDEARTKKLLRFGTDHPRCADCKSTDVRTLCRVRGSRKGPDGILCRTCKAKRKPLSAKASAQKAKRFKEAGYFKPVCVVCHDPTLQVLELDHAACAANSGLVEPLCANHHAIKSFIAESDPMAALRLRDQNRSALVLQAAFELGAGAVLGMFAVWDGAHEETARSIFFGVLSGVLFAWAMWNLAADVHFTRVLGPGYDRAIPAEVPR